MKPLTHFLTAPKALGEFYPSTAWARSRLPGTDRTINPSALRGEGIATLSISPPVAFTLRVWRNTEKMI